MSDSILLEGKKGHGKSLVQVKIIHSYLAQNKMVATNLNLFIEKLMPPLSMATAIRLPDVPTVQDLEMIGISTAHHVAKDVGWQEVDRLTRELREAVQPDTAIRDKFYLVDEERYGLLNLDEVGSFLNSRNWQGSERLGVIAYLSQCRKLGWDSLLSAQHSKMVDSQIRTALCDIRGVAKRLDKIAFPFLAPIYKHFTGKRLRLPKLHICTFFYGFEKNAPVSWREFYTGADVWDGYDTTQKISGITGNQHTYCYLSAWHLKGRYMTPMQLHGRLAISALIAGLFIGFLMGWFFSPSPSANVPASTAPTVSQSVYVVGVLADGLTKTVLLSDGRSLNATEYQIDSSGARYFAAGQWYEVQK